MDDINQQKFDRDLVIIVDKEDDLNFYMAEKTKFGGYKDFNYPKDDPESLKEETKKKEELLKCIHGLLNVKRLAKVYKRLFMNDGLTEIRAIGMVVE